MLSGIVTRGRSYDTPCMPIPAVLCGAGAASLMSRCRLRHQTVLKTDMTGAARYPRIELAPDPARIRVLPDADGVQSQVIGASGAACDRRARFVRIVNLCTADEVATRVSADGSFQARLVAPAGSVLQVTTVILEDDALPLELREALQRNGCMTPADLPHAEFYIGLIGSHPSCSPGTILPVLPGPVSDTRWPAFVRKVGERHWLVGRAEAAESRIEPGDRLDIDIHLMSVFDTSRPSQDADRVPQVALALHRLFDQRGRQRSFGRQPTSDVLTPTGLPIETHGEMVAEPRPDGTQVWNLGGTGIPVRHDAGDERKMAESGGRTRGD